MGMVGAPRDAGTTQVWSERQFDAMDFALLCAYTHPDPPGPELDLVADWYMWVFYFGDHFLETFKRSRDPDGARKHLSRLHSFMPQQPAESSPDPASHHDPAPATVPNPIGSHRAGYHAAQSWMAKPPRPDTTLPPHLAARWRAHRPQASRGAPPNLADHDREELP